MRTLALVLLLIPSLAIARPPSKKEIDQELVRMSIADLTDLRAAESSLRDATAQLEAAEQEGNNAALDGKAARSWVDAGKAIIKALEAETKAADAWARVDQRADLASKSTVAEANLSWREAQLEASKEFQTFQQTRINWAKAVVETAKSQIAVERLIAYDTKIGGSPDAQLELGKQQQALGKAKSNEGKMRGKMDKAEADWQSAVGKAQHLDPNAGK